MADYCVTLELQKKSFIEPAETSCPHWLKITFMEGVRSPSPYLKNIFLNILSNTYLDFISVMEVTDHRHYDQ